MKAMEYNLRKANLTEQLTIWEILQQAILRRKADGSNQWQDGYPNLEVVRNDIESGTGFVLTKGEIIIGYCAILINDEPAYVNIEGKWLTNGDFIVVHRVAIAKNYLGQGLSKKMFELIETFAINKKINSIKVDTNFDNIAMIKILEKTGYIYCGEVFFRGSPRKAYEKLLN